MDLRNLLGTIARVQKLLKDNHADKSLTSFNVTFHSPLRIVYDCLKQYRDKVVSSTISEVTVTFDLELFDLFLRREEYRKWKQKLVLHNIKVETTRSNSLLTLIYRNTAAEVEFISFEFMFDNPSRPYNISPISLILTQIAVRRLDLN